MNRLTENDKNWGPFTVARWKNKFGISLDGPEYDYGDSCSSMTIVMFGWALRSKLPFHIPACHEYGLSLSAIGGNGYDFFQIHYGLQSWDSNETKAWFTHLPWKQWNHVRHSLYNPDGSHFYTPDKGNWGGWDEAKEAVSKSRFEFRDFDGVLIEAVCTVSEREWHKGCGVFKWLRYFYPKKVIRSLDLRFSKEVGPGKNTWKGGTIGHGIDMLNGESPKQAFIRYCENGYNRRGEKTTLTFIREI